MLATADFGDLPDDCATGGFASAFADTGERAASGTQRSHPLRDLVNDDCRHHNHVNDDP